MKTLILVIISLMSCSLWADSDRREDRRHFNPSVFDVIPLNSPVKESVARFLIKIPSGFEIDEVTYQIRNAGRIFEKVKSHQKINLVNGPQGKELQINVSKLPPGFFQLFIKVKDKKNKEHEYKNKYKDHAMFVIDQSMEVPMPNSKINDSTVAGIDSDNDGIRDDIQRWINETYSTQPKVKLAMKQMAMGMQMVLLSIANKEQSIIAANKYLDDSICLETVVGFDEETKHRHEMKEKLLNTKDRHYAEIKSNANFSGQSRMNPETPEDKKALCNFDTSMP